MGCLVKGGNKAPKAKVVFSRSLDSTCLVFALSPLSIALWSSRSSHAQSILSFPHNTLSSQAIEDFHRTVRRGRPHFQPEFYPRCSDHSRQEGQTRTRTRTLSGVKGTAPGAVPN